MAVRTIIRIDEEACDGCGLCAAACHEGAIAIVNGKARLIRDEYCDGLGACLPVCPTGAITFETREAAPFDEELVRRHLAARPAAEAADGPAAGRPVSGPAAEEPGGGAGDAGERGRAHGHGSPAGPAGGCPGSRISFFARREWPAPEQTPADAGEHPAASGDGRTGSELSQWPVQLQLVPVRAPFFDQADLLVAADCSAYACGDFHRRFMRGRVALIGCPKLDAADYADKLASILWHNDIRSVTVVRMEVPCCGGIEAAVMAAVEAAAAGGKPVPWRAVVLTRDGRVLA